MRDSSSSDKARLWRSAASVAPTRGGSVAGAALIEEESDEAGRAATKYPL